MIKKNTCNFDINNIVVLFLFSIFQLFSKFQKKTDGKPKKKKENLFVMENQC